MTESSANGIQDALLDMKMENLKKRFEGTKAYERFQKIVVEKEVQKICDELMEAYQVQMNACERIPKAIRDELCDREFFQEEFYEYLLCRAYALAFTRYIDAGKAIEESLEEIVSRDFIVEVFAATLDYYKKMAEEYPAKRGGF